MEKFEKLRKLAGIEGSKKSNKVVIKEDVTKEINGPIKAGGKHLFYLVTGATPNSTMSDVISEVDTVAFAQIAVGAGAKAAKEEKWELFPHTMQQEALELARERLAAAKSLKEDEAEKCPTSILKAVESMIEERQNKADKADDKDMKDMYKKDATIFAIMYGAMKAGDKDGARRAFSRLETEPRDALFDVVNKKDRKMLADFLGTRLIHENVDTLEKRDEKSGLEVKCPTCDKIMDYNVFPDHAMEHAAPKKEEDNEESKFKKGQKVKHGKMTFTVVVPDARGPMVGVAPVGQEQMTDAIRLVKADELEIVNEEKKKDEKVACVSCGSMFVPMYDGHRGTCPLCVQKQQAGVNEAVKVAKTVQVRHQDGRKDRWAVYVDGKMVEGGFFEKEAAEEAAEEYRKEQIEEADLKVTSKPLPLTPDKVFDREKVEDLTKPAYNHDEKVTVPASVMTSLKNKIREVKDMAEKYKTRDELTAGFYLTVADALEVLQKHLEKGTIHCLKMAQVDMTKLMSIIVDQIPKDVYEFIVHGGKVIKTLKDRYHEVKSKKEE